MAVFAGGWTLEAAETVCGGKGIEPYQVLDLLSQLVNKSLVTMPDEHGELRYHRLETIRQYAREKLFETGGSRAPPRQTFRLLYSTSGGGIEELIGTMI